MKALLIFNILCRLMIGFFASCVRVRDQSAVPWNEIFFYIMMAVSITDVWGLWRCMQQRIDCPRIVRVCVVQVAGYGEMVVRVRDMFALAVLTFDPYSWHGCRAWAYVKSSSSRRDFSSGH